MHEAERALFDLRRGRPLYVTASSPRNPEGPGSEHAALVATIEGLQPETLASLRHLGTGAPRLAVTRHRAQALGLTLHLRGSSNGRARGMSLGLDDATDPEQILRLASVTGGYASRVLEVREASAPEDSALTLARLGRLLPALVSVPADRTTTPDLDGSLKGGDVLTVTTSQIAAMVGSSHVGVRYVSGAPVPLEDAEDARFMLFREANGLLEHVAILIGDMTDWPDPVPLRLHSACLTGDLFGSLRCDCGEQLRQSLSQFSERGAGVLLYLAQEGRGIGLGNKLRAYALQNEGLDTIDADCALGFSADERHYQAAIEILRQLQIERVQLLTNNPEKVRALREGGIRVLDRQPLHGTLNRHNLPYVRTKVHRAGHWLGDMLYGANSGK